LRDCCGAAADHASLENSKWYLHARVRNREFSLHLDVVVEHSLQLGDMNHRMDSAAFREIETIGHLAHTS
jgi:hypothetical protein